MPNPYLHTKSLFIGHDHASLAGPIDIDLNQGDCLAVFGRNGSGKSTLLHTLCKFIPSIKGEIFIAGKNLRHLNFRELAVHISIVFAGRREVVPQITVDEILKLGRFPYIGYYSKLSQQDKQVIEEVISSLQLEHLLYKNISNLSDGEAQKVFIARALVQDTDIMIFDEPTTHLDLFNKHEIFSIIKNLSNKQKTIILSTHEIHHALTIANKCILFGDGKVQYGNKDEMEREGVVKGYFGGVMA